MTYFQNHATHEVGHAVGARTLTAAGYSIKGDDWAKQYGNWKRDGSPFGYAINLDFTPGMWFADYTLTQGVKAGTYSGFDIVTFLTTIAEKGTGGVATDKLVVKFGSVANAFTAIKSDPTLATNPLVTTVDTMKANMPGRSFYFPSGIPGGGKVNMFSTREDDKWVTYDKACWTNKVSHYSVSSSGEMFAELYTAKFTGGGLPPANAGKDPAAFFTALENADPTELGLPASGGSSPGAGARPEGAGGETGPAGAAGASDQQTGDEPSGEPESRVWP